MRRNVIVVSLVALLALSSCKKVCDYRQPIEDLFVTNWDSLPLPNRGKVYSFKAGTHFTELIDSFDLPIIERNPAHTTWITCSFGTRKPTHENDLRLMLDDSLVYDISNVIISRILDQRRWTMGGPTERCVISSLNVNGHLSKEIVRAGQLAFPREYARVLKRW